MLAKLHDERLDVFSSLGQPTINPLASWRNCKFRVAADKRITAKLKYMPCMSSQYSSRSSAARVIGIIAGRKRILIDILASVRPCFAPPGCIAMMRIGLKPRLPQSLSKKSERGCRPAAACVALQQQGQCRAGMQQMADQQQQEAVDASLNETPRGRFWPGKRQSCGLSVVPISSRCGYHEHGEILLEIGQVRI